MSGNLPKAPPMSQFELFDLLRMIIIYIKKNNKYLYKKSLETYWRHHVI